jgi:hypothetical protein
LFCEFLRGKNLTVLLFSWGQKQNGVTKILKFKLLRITYKTQIFNGKIVFSDSGDQICDYCNFVTIDLLMVELEDFRNVWIKTTLGLIPMKNQLFQISNFPIWRKLYLIIFYSWVQLTESSKDSGWQKFQELWFLNPKCLK